MDEAMVPIEDEEGGFFRLSEFKSVPGHPQIRLHPDGYHLLHFKRKGYVARPLSRIISYRDGQQVYHITSKTAMVLTFHPFVIRHRYRVEGLSLPTLRQVPIIYPAKLSDDDVREIRRLLKLGYKCSQLAYQFGVSRQSIHAIKHGKLHAGVK